MSAAKSSRRERIAIDEHPITLKLDHGPNGTPKVSMRGGATDYQYICDDNTKIMWLPPAGQAAILHSGARKGDFIYISRNRDGSYDAELVSDASEPQQQQPTRALAVVPTKRQPAPQQQSATPAPQQQQPPTVHPLVDLMTRCIVSGAHANIAAHQQLAAQGINFPAPTWDEIRATGTTFFIERNKVRQ